MTNAGKTRGITLRTLQIYLLATTEQPGYHSVSFSEVSMLHFTIASTIGPNLVNWNIYIITINGITRKVKFIIIRVPQKIL